MSALLDVTSFSHAAEAELQRLPCNISHQGDAKVDDFFNTTVRTEDDSSDKSRTATFRGRPLNGCDIEVPSGYKGIVVKEHRKPFNEDEERRFQVTHQFKKITAWNLDKKCSANDKIFHALDWINVAKLIHNDDDEEEEEKENKEETAKD